MNVLVTGAAGFLGSRVVEDLLSGRSDIPTPKRIVAADLDEPTIAPARIEPHIGSIGDEAFVQEIVDDEVDVVFHLAAVLSGQAEAEFDLADGPGFLDERS